MKQRVFVFLGFIILFIFIGFAVYVVRQRTPRQGELRVESQPVANVFINDKNIGRSPIGKSPYKLDAGEYTLKIVPDTGVTDFISWQEKIKIGSNVLTYVNAALSESELTSQSYVLWLEKIPGKKSEFSLTTSPDGATLLFDDEMKGTTPVTIPDVSPGDHTVTIVSRGFNTRSMKVRFNAGYRLIANVKLALTGGSIRESEASASGMVQGISTDAKNTPTPTPKLKGTGTISPSPKPGIVSREPAKPYVLIGDTPTGFLRVRVNPSTTGSEIGRVKPGEKYSLLDTKDTWFQIQFDATQSGWISGQYAGKVE